MAEAADKRKYICILGPAKNDNVMQDPFGKESGFTTLHHKCAVTINACFITHWCFFNFIANQQCLIGLEWLQLHTHHFTIP